EAPVTEVKFAKQILAMARKELSLPDAAQAEIQAIAFGDAVIVGLPAELFVEFGLRIKSGSPFPLTIVNELTNGSVSGYVCTQEAYRQGGYETRLRPYSRLHEETGDLFVEHALKLLHRLRAEQ
ncbi:MAG: Alkaline ceramidase domain protein, partial [Paenibacillus sp.]|nr:Alkaline ceramidase domain protein [Paenibacillus sp.]